MIKPGQLDSWSLSSARAKARRDGMIGDAGEHVGEPGLGIDVVELGDRDQRLIALPLTSQQKHRTRRPLGRANDGNRSRPQNRRSNRDAFPLQFGTNERPVSRRNDGIEIDNSARG